MKYQSCSSRIAIVIWTALATADSAPAQTFTASVKEINFMMTADSTSVTLPLSFQVASATGNVPFAVAAEQTNDCSKFPSDPVFVWVSQSSATTPATVTVSLMPITLSWGYGLYCDAVAILDESGHGLAVDVVLDVNLPPPTERRGGPARGYFAARRLSRRDRQHFRLSHRAWHTGRRVSIDFAQ